MEVVICVGNQQVDVCEVVLVDDVCCIVTWASDRKIVLVDVMWCVKNRSAMTVSDVKGLLVCCAE